jgi:succinate-acetate transporter protein
MCGYLSGVHGSDPVGPARSDAEGQTFGRAQRDAYPPAILALRPIGNPLTMGLIGLAVATLVVSGLEFRWYGDERLQVGLIVLIVAPLLQTIASVIAFRARDSVAGTAMGVQAATWLYTGVVIATTPAGSHSDVLGTALLVSGAAILLTSVNAARFKGLFGLVIGVTGVRWLLSGISQTSGTESWGDAAGVVGLILAGLALLAASVGETEEETDKVLPIALRRDRGERVFHPVDEDLQRRAASDPGARDLL